MYKTWIKKYIVWSFFKIISYTNLYLNEICFIHFTISDSLYRIFPCSRIKGIFPVSLQFWRVREEMCKSWQTSRFVRYFSPLRCGVRFCRSCWMVADSSSKAVKNETICRDLLLSISMIHWLLISHIIAHRGNSKHI